MKKLTLPVTSGMRFDIWLKRSRENSSPLLQFSAGGKLSMR
jgi:beta-fructofuranosidase